MSSSNCLTEHQQQRLRVFFRRIRFCKRAATTLKPEIPELAKQKAKIFTTSTGKFRLEKYHSRFDDH